MTYELLKRAVKILQEKWTAENAIYALKQLIAHEIFIAEEEATRKITLFFDSVYSADLKKLETAVQIASNKCDTEFERLALEENAGAFPLGTKLKLVQKKKWPLTGFEETLGVYEAVTRNTILPNNMPKYCKPEVGTFIIRLLKADGKTLGKRIETHTFGWIPVDEKKTI